MFNTMLFNGPFSTEDIAPATRLNRPAMAVAKPIAPRMAHRHRGTNMYGPPMPALTPDLTIDADAPVDADGPYDAGSGSTNVYAKAKGRAISAKPSIFSVGSRRAGVK